MPDTFEAERIYWLSGSPCAGKTSISTLLAERNDWQVYHADAQWENHKQRASKDLHPHWHAYSRLTGDPLWMQDPEMHVASAERAYDEEFLLILEDLAELTKSDGRPVIFDGYVSPKNLQQVLFAHSHVFYLVAAEKFQLHYYAQRPWIREVLAKTSHPEKAWANWMSRDSIWARRMESELSRSAMPWMTVDGAMTLEESAQRIAEQFGGAKRKS